MAKMKKFVIDGHNLIPKVPGITLQDDEDENRLIEMVNEFCRLSRSQVELFFDGAPPLHPPAKKSGLVHPHFVRQGYAADDAIIEFVHKNQNPENIFTVVSSDQRVISAVKHGGAEVMTSESFAAEMQRVFSNPQAVQELRNKKLSEREVDAWLEEFQKNQFRPNNS
jgi:predicted RNA-binding protein with PIN domain